LSNIISISSQLWL